MIRVWMLMVGLVVGAAAYGQSAVQAGPAYTPGGAPGSIPLSSLQAIPPGTVLNATNCTGSTASTVIATTTPCAGALNLEGGVAADGESSLYLTGTVIPTGVKGFGINVSAAFAPSTTTTQNIEGINVEPILDNAAGPITSITGVSTLVQINADYTQTTPSSIDYFSSCGYWSDLRSNALTSAPPLNACFLGQPVLIGNGITSGTVLNIQFYAPASISGLVTSAAALGGTMYNYAFRATVPTGSGAGTNSNYGLYISGNGGSGGTGTTVNWAIDSVSTADSQITGGLDSTPIGAATPSTGAFTTLKASSGLATNYTSSNGTLFTVSGCGTAVTPTGGSSAGYWQVGTGASPCTFVLTLGGITATHSWMCNAVDQTSGTVLPQTNTNPTTCTVKGNAATNDYIVFSATAY